MSRWPHPYGAPPAPPEWRLAIGDLLREQREIGAAVDVRRAAEALRRRTAAAGGSGGAAEPAGNLDECDDDDDEQQPPPAD
jgi:hypothetical protein